MTTSKDQRAFALPIVFLVLLLIGIAFVGLSDTMVVAAQTSGRRDDAQKMFYACEGVVRLAQGMLKELSLDDPSIDFADLDVALAPVKQVALENGIDLSPPSNQPEETVILEDPPLAGMEVLASIGSFGASTPTAGGGCNVNISQPLGKISPLQFFAFSVEGGDIDVGTTGVPANPDFTFGRTKITSPAALAALITEVDVLGAPIRLPAPGEPEVGVNAARNRTFKPYLQPPFTNNPTRVAERASSRFAYQADIRIVDGEWYLRDPSNVTAWPGIPIWGDHPCISHATPEKTCAASFNNDTPQPLGMYDADGGGSPARGVSPLRRLYSAYERVQSGIVVSGASPKGVVSYGKLANVSGFTEPGLTPTGASGTPCPQTTPAVSVVGVSRCTGDQQMSAVLGAREAFADPLSGAAVLPINIDVGLLAQALGTPINDEIGSKVCLSGCRRVFNGMIYVTSTQGLPPSLAPGPLPYALCGGDPATGDVSIDKGKNPGQPLQPCASAVRYNAVRLHDAAIVSAFAQTGLTIGTDLPMYVEGDFNRGTGGAFRTLLMADRVSVLSSGFRDDGTTAGSPSVELGTSLITGWGAAPASPRKFGDLVRTVESVSVSVRVAGALVAGFTSAVGAGRTGARISQWAHPLQLTRPTNDAQPPGVPRMSLGLPAEVTEGE